MQNIEDLELLTDRLRLKVLGPDFAHQSLDYYTRNHNVLSEWNPTPGPDFYALPYHQARLQSELDLMNEGRLVRFWLFKHEDVDWTTAIGNLGFNNIVRGAFQSCHLGYQLDEREINQGFMTEALRCAIAFAFNLQRVPGLRPGERHREYPLPRTIGGAGRVGGIVGCDNAGAPIRKSGGSAPKAQPWAPRSANGGACQRRTCALRQAASAASATIALESQSAAVPTVALAVGLTARAHAQP